MAVLGQMNIYPTKYHHRQSSRKSTVGCSLAISHTALSCGCGAQNLVNLVQNEGISSSVLLHGSDKNQLFTKVSSSDKLIKELADNGLVFDVVRVYLDIFEDGALDEFHSFAVLVKAIGKFCDIKLGRQIHSHLLKIGVLDDIYVGNSLLGLFWRCGATDAAAKMFEKMQERDSVSWNTMISGFHQSRQYVDSLGWFRSMILESGTHLNRIACISALSACASIGSLVHGKEIHASVIKSGLDVNEFVVNGLLNMYMKCGAIMCAELVFEDILKSCRLNPVLWNVMILGYADNDHFLQGYLLYSEMMMSVVVPDSSTMVAVLVLCSKSLNLCLGHQIHGFIVKLGLGLDVRVETALTDMYFKCCEVESGLRIFRMSQNCNLVTWGVVMSGCIQRGYAKEVLDLYHDVRCEYQCVDSIIVLAALRACSSLNLKPEGMEIHALAVKLGLDADTYVGGAFVDMYMKTHDMESAEKVFRRLPAKDVISWNALISGYNRADFVDSVLKSFHDMQSEEIKPNEVTVACMLSICAHMSANMLCKEIHNYVMRHGFQINVLVNNSLIAAYAKCGNMKSSWTIFESMKDRDRVSWNAIILGLAMHGCTDELFVMFEKMKEAGMQPDHTTFTSVLSACSHTGRVDEGWRYFKEMIQVHGLEPKLEQYTCMVDLLGRSGYLNQAYELILLMPCHPDDRIWGSLLGSCGTHGEEELAEVVSDHIFELNPANMGYHVLLSNLYEVSGKYEEVAKVRYKIKDMGLEKSPGCSWVEVGNQIHVFTAADQSHNQSLEIYTAMQNLTREIKLAGYIPQVGHSA